MERLVYEHLQAWRRSRKRKALLVRGARQVGKTFSVRQLGHEFRRFVEVNFEEEPAVARLFAGSRNAAALCEKLSAYFRTTIVPGETLLFLDEIQACPDALASLRFFYEQMPELHVVAAGSLLEFALSEIPSMGVGRIESLFLYPLSFREYVTALGEDRLLDLIRRAGPAAPLDAVLHERLVELVRTYQLIGGLPEVVQYYVDTRDLNGCARLISRLITTLQDDFAKYRQRAPVARLTDVFRAVALQAGGKFTYTKVDALAGGREIKSALEMLIMAGLAYRVPHTSAQGVPLGAQTNPRRFKVLPFDLGVYQRLSGLSQPEQLVADERTLVNMGAVAEVLVGLELVAAADPHQRPELYYWHREARKSNAEVDYVIESASHIVPVEVKAGTRGGMQSMNAFLDSHPVSSWGCRLSLENYSSYSRIRTIPLYAAWTLVSGS